jgi:ribosomal protein S18 acetylase RimI-like enzyme
LLDAVIQRAKKMPFKTLFLLSNKKAEAAVHLYEKLGFRHDAEIMAHYGASYDRCNVAMRYTGFQ